jgi:hypothetical protein
VIDDEIRQAKSIAVSTTLSLSPATSHALM